MDVYFTGKTLLEMVSSEYDLLFHPPGYYEVNIDGTTHIGVGALRLLRAINEAGSEGYKLRRRDPTILVPSLVKLGLLGRGGDRRREFRYFVVEEALARVVLGEFVGSRVSKTSE